MFDPREKVALFIDGANLYSTARSIGFDIDYKMLLQEFQKTGYLLRAYYYTALIEDQEYSSIRPLIDWLDYNGYKVVTKPVKEFVDSSGAARSRGTWTSSLRSMPWRSSSSSTTSSCSRRRRFPLAGGSPAAQGAQGHCRFNPANPAADDRGRLASAGRPFRRPCDPGQEGGA